MREATHRRLQNAAIILGILLFGALCGYTADGVSGNWRVGGDLVVVQDVSIGRDLTITDDLIVTDDSTFSDAIAVTGTSNLAIVEVDTLKPGSGTAFYLRAYDGQNDAALNCATFTGDLTGDLTGSPTQSITYKGNLPTNTGGEELGEFYRNTAGDTLWYGDDNSWVQIAP